MQRKITLGSSDGIILDSGTKQKVIDYLYSKIDLSKYRYIILNNIQKLKFLQDNEHYVAPNFKGFNYLILFLTISEKQYCVVIDRKKLSYHKEQLDIKMVQIINIQMKTSDSIYRGTIFDGKIIQTNNEFIFLIQDCFYLMGNKLLEMEINQKMSHLDTILKTHFRKDKNINCCLNFDFKLNKLYKYNELETLINTTMTKSTIGTNGIIFYPKFSGVTILHIEKKVEKIDISSNNTTNTQFIDSKSYDIIHNFVDFLKSRTYSYEQNGKNKVCWLTRTLIPDVYDISEKENGDKLGIALIPNLKISHLCNNLINDKPVQFNCIYSNRFKKWIPLNVSN